MAKVVKFDVAITPEKFGLQRVKRKRAKTSGKPTSQLDLFTGGKVVRLHNLSLFDEALSLDERGDMDGARKLYMQSIDSNDDNRADALCNLGIIHFKNDQLVKAIDCFARCLSLEPRHCEAQYNLANSYAEAGNFMLAKIHYQVALEISPSFPNTYFNLALCLAMLDEYDGAVTMLNRFRELTPSEDHRHTNELIDKLERACRS